MLYSCIDQIILDLDETEANRQLLIDGEITTGAGPFELRLNYVEGFGLSEQTPIDGANAVLLDSEGNRATYNYIEEGLYRIDENDFTVQKGRSYHIEVQIGNNTYQSLPELVPDPVPVDRIHFEINRRSVTGSETEGILRRVMDVMVDLSVPEDASDLYIRWTAKEAWSMLGTQPPPPGTAALCYYMANPNPQDIFLLDASRIRSGQLKDQLVAFRGLDWSFHTRHVFLVEQKSITREAYEYWENVRLVNNQNGSIFDIPPASINGNVFNTQDQNEIVLGYFGVVSITEARLVVNKNNLGSIRVDPPCRLFWYSYNSGLGEEVPGFCYSCWQLDNFYPGRPDFY